MALPHWVVLYITVGLPYTELPKKRSEPWYWYQYLEKAGLPRQDEWDESLHYHLKTQETDLRTECVEFFLSRS